MLLKNVLSLNIHPKDGSAYPVEVAVGKIGNSRYASRDVEATEGMLQEIQSRGYLVHEAAGICFRSRYLLTTEDAIEVQGPQTSGEVEFVAVMHGGNLYISVGSDHNDRSVEDLSTAMLGKIYDTAKSKQMVPAVMARDAWLYEDVKEHWDEIVIKSAVTMSGQRIPYQEAKLASLLDLEYYMSRDAWFREDGSVLMGGSGGMSTVLPEELYQGQATQEGVTFPADFQFEMSDPILNRTISHGYDVISLEAAGSLSL